MSQWSQPLQRLQGPGPRARACARAPGQPGEREAAVPHLAFNLSPSRSGGGRNGCRDPDAGLRARLDLTPRRKGGSSGARLACYRPGSARAAERAGKRGGERSLARSCGGCSGSGGGGPRGELRSAAATASAVGAEKRVRAAETEGRTGEPAGRAARVLGGLSSRPCGCSGAAGSAPSRDPRGRGGAAGPGPRDRRAGLLAASPRTRVQPRGAPQFPPAAGWRRGRGAAARGNTIY